MGSSESKNKAMEQEQEQIAVKMTHDCYEHYQLISEGKVLLFKCDGCKMDGSGPRYVCSLCDTALHKWCRYPQPTISHDYFKHSTLKFTSTVTPQVSKHCAACWKDVLGFSYHCRDRKLDLHPSCYKLDTKIFFDNMLFTLHDKLSQVCVGCKNTNTKGWSYVSSCNKYHFHVQCLMEKVHDFEMKHGDNSYSNTNKVEMKEVDLASVLEPKIQSEVEVTPDQLFMGYVTDNAAINSPKKEETGASEPGKNGIGERIAKFFRTLFRSLIEGVTITCEYVHKVAKMLWLKITPEWCQKIINFCRILLEISIAVHNYMKGTSKVTGEMVQKIAKRFNVIITCEQGEMFLQVLELLIKLVKPTMAPFM